MFPSLDTVASEAISFEQMIVISTATMAQIHLMQAFQGLFHPLEVINRGKISFFHHRKREERNRHLLREESSLLTIPWESYVSLTFGIMCLLERKGIGWPNVQDCIFTLFPCLSSFVFARFARLLLLGFYCKGKPLFTIQKWNRIVKCSIIQRDTNIEI